MMNPLYKLHKPHCVFQLHCALTLLVFCLQYKKKQVKSTISFNFIAHLVKSFHKHIHVTQLRCGCQWAGETLKTTGTIFIFCPNVKTNSQYHPGRSQWSSAGLCWFEHGRILFWLVVLQWAKKKKRNFHSIPQNLPCREHNKIYFEIWGTHTYTFQQFNSVVYTFVKVDLTKPESSLNIKKHRGIMQE